MRLAVIPARGGSKRIPRKNIKLFCGKPMIAWSIEAAHESACFDRVVVSTDDLEIADVAREWGAEVPFMRPLELSDDNTGTTPVISQAIEWQQQHGDQPTEVCCIYATAPFLQSKYLRRGLKVLRETDCDYAFSVTRYPSPIQRAIRITGLGKLEMFSPENFNIRSQDLEEAYHDAAQFYWGRPQAWLAGKPIFSPCAAAIILPRYLVQDIDIPEDWARAELMFRSMLQKKTTDEAYCHDCK